MNSNRRQFLLSSTALGASAFTGSVLAEAKFPDHPITIIDSFAAGGSSDVFARVLAERMAPFLGGTVIVDNKPGAGGALGSEFVAKARPDGYTLGMATVSTLATAPAVNPKVRYDPLKDFAHITNVLTVPSVLVVHPSVSAKNLKELVQLSKDKPGTVSFATPGVGSAGHVLLEHFMQLSGAKFLHVPYKGSAPMINDLLGGQLMVASDNLPSMLPHIQAGKVRAIAVRDNKRLESLPSVPTYAEEGYPLVSEPLWFGLVAPAGTPHDIVMRLNLAAHQAIATPEFSARLKQASAVAAPTTPEAFAEQARALYERYRVVVREANIKLD
ncbi:MAG: tripartite tricarboxylate transporter substrate-binding protein [Rhizobacter sp.]